MVERDPRSLFPSLSRGDPCLAGGGPFPRLNLQGILALAKKEWLQIVRDPITALIALVLPPFMIVLFGTAITLDLKSIPFAYLDLDRSRSSREVLARMSATGYFQNLGSVSTPEELERLLDQGTIRLGLWFPRGWGREQWRGTPRPLLILVDGSDANTARLARGALEGFQLKLLARRGSAPLRLQERFWYNPELKSPFFFIPGLMGIVLLITCVVLTALSLVREKERGTMEVLQVAPLHPLEILLGKILPYSSLAFVALILALLVGLLGFGMPFRGSFVLFLIMGCLFIVVGLTYGVFISSLTQKQELAWMLSVITTLLPSMILSGFIFPIASMPRFLQFLTYLFPARYMIAIFREIIVKGNGLGALGKELLPLFLLFLAISARTFANLRKRG